MINATRTHVTRTEDLTHCTELTHLTCGAYLCQQDAIFTFSTFSKLHSKVETPQINGISLIMFQHSVIWNTLPCLAFTQVFSQSFAHFVSSILHFAMHGQFHLLSEEKLDFKTEDYTTFPLVPILKGKLLLLAGVVQVFIGGELWTRSW